MAVPATALPASGCTRAARPDAGNTRPRLTTCSAHRAAPKRPHRPRSRPVFGPPLRQLASDPSVPVEGGCANDYVYTYGDPVNTFDVGGTQTSPPNSSQSRRCSGIKAKIKNLRNSLSRQKQNFHLNRNKWTLDHPEALSHQETFRRQQGALRGRLTEWDDNDCDDSGVGGLPSGAWAFATMATPAPNQNPPEPSASFASRFGNWVENLFSGADGRPGYTK